MIFNEKYLPFYRKPINKYFSIYNLCQFALKKSKDSYTKLIKCLDNKRINDIEKVIKQNCFLYYDIQSVIERKLKKQMIKKTFEKLLAEIKKAA